MKSRKLNYYLVLSAGTSCVATVAQAAIVNIDVSSVSGVNGGLIDGSSTIISLPAGGIIEVFNNTYANFGDSFGLTVSSPGGIAVEDFGRSANPSQIAVGETIDSSTGFYFASFNSRDASVFFTDYSGGAISQDFGPDSYIAFQDGSGNFGWVEVTWNGLSREFQILAAAYEDSGAPIVAGQSAIPEPSSIALLALGAGGLTMRRRRKNV